MTVTLAPVRALLDHPLFRAGLAGACVLGGVAVIQAVQQEQQERLDALNEAIGHRRAELVSLRAQVARARADATFPDRAPVNVGPAVWSADRAPVNVGPAVWSAEDGGPVDVDQADAAPVATEPGCSHPDCVLDHPHAGPAILTDAP